MLDCVECFKKILFVSKPVLFSLCFIFLLKKTKKVSHQHSLMNKNGNIEKYFIVFFLIFPYFFNTSRLIFVSSCIFLLLYVTQADKPIQSTKKGWIVTFSRAYRSLFDTISMAILSIFQATKKLFDCFVFGRRKIFSGEDIFLLLFFSIFRSR